METVVSTPCKVNVHLGVHAQRDERGYHRVDSAMLPVALCDVVRVEDADELSVSFSPSLGCRVVTDSVTYKDGEEISREFLHNSIYRAQAPVIRRNSG